MTGAERGRGWVGVAGLALATTAFWVVQPAVLMFVPLALLFIGLPPRRPLLLALGVFIAWLAFRAPAAPAGTRWYFERGWTLLLGAWFLVIVVARPEWRFMPRALVALAATVVTAGVLLVLSRGGFAALDTAIGDQMRLAAEQAIVALREAAASGEVRQDIRRAIMLAAEFQAKLFPALLALSSLAALGVAWWAFGRIGRGESRPLGRLREFRFRDELVWLLLIGMALLVLPVNQLATRAGENLLAFMGVLYALRGVAVLLVLGGVPGPFGMLLGAVVVLFLAPFVMATTFVVGLSDTWLDIRARREASATRGS